jgi:peptidoglycan/LPS O-acetylase OafA/YrhL
MEHIFFNFFKISNVKRISFRNDINGLRCVAVLSVVFYHADITVFKGGWLGVDIFFVISGYLISNIIISELNEGNFKFKNFYIRRIKRILPALISTLLLTLPFAYWLLSPKAMYEFLNSMIASVLFFSNYYFMNLEFYIAESTKVMPLLHTWSLSIEEQYYILFPILSVLLFKNFKKYFTLVIICLAAGSIYLNILSQDVSKFYQLQFRIWELFVGVLVMIISSNIKIKHLEKIGFPTVVFSMFYFDDTMINHIEPKLVALLGVALVIFSNNDSTYLSKILNRKIISAIGLSSYSVYLLHQPLFAFFRILNDDNLEIITLEKSNYFLDYQTKFFLIFILLFLGYLQYIVVEKMLPTSQFLYPVIVSSLAIILVLAILGRTGTGNENRFDSGNDLVQTALTFQDLNKFDLIINNETCHKSSLKDEVTSLCSIQNSDKSREVIVLGDSHSRLLLKPLSNKLTQNSITFVTGDSCIYFSDFVNEDCKRSDREDILKFVNSLDNKIIIYIADLQDKLDDSSKDVIENVPYTLNKLAEKNIVIVVKQIPPFPVNVVNRILNNPQLTAVKYPSVEWESNEKRLTLEDMYSKVNIKNIFMIDTFNIFCSEIENGFCVGADKTNIYIHDDNHPSDKGSELIIDKILSIIKNIDI